MLSKPKTPTWPYWNVTNLRLLVETKTETQKQEDREKEEITIRVKQL
jgi:hypothetical protein